MDSTTPFFVQRFTGRVISTAIKPCAFAFAGLLLSACQPDVSSPTTPIAKESTAMLPLPTTTVYGQLTSGESVLQVQLDNGHGVSVDVISYGGIITKLITPDNQGQAGDIVLGFDSLADYEQKNPYFGALIGRYGNRIANGQFSLDGQQISLERNDGDNHLHGGKQGFDKKNWHMRPFSTAQSVGVTLSLKSPDGDQGYPGNLDVQVVYELTVDNRLDIRFQATTDKPTVVNLTQHSYFNLAGQGDILAHELMIPASQITPVRAGLIPTGELQAVAGTVFDFQQAKPIGKDIEKSDPQLALGLGYDHNFVLKPAADKQLLLAGRVHEPHSGRVLEVWTDEPAVQFYSGNFLDGSLAGKGRVFAHRSGFCLEPQHNPDSPNQAQFASTTLLPDELYQSRIQYRFSTDVTP